MPRILFLVCYDIAEPKRLRRVHRLVKGFAIGGQKSFYECWLTRNDFVELEDHLKEIMDLSSDKVHFFQLDLQIEPIFIGQAHRQSIKPFLIV